MDDIGKRSQVFYIIVIVSGCLVALAIGAFGVFCAYLGATGNSQFAAFGTRFASGSVGVSALFIAFLLMYAIVTRTLSSFDKQRSSVRTPGRADGNYSWADMDLGLAKIQTDMAKAKFKPDIVIGLGRSGGVVGGVLASRLGSLPFTVIDLKYWRESHKLAVDLFSDSFRLEENTERALVIEGATTSGGTPAKAKDCLNSAFPKIEFRFAVLVQGGTSSFTCDYFGFLEPGAVKSLPWHGPLSETFLSPSQPQDYTPSRQA